MKSRLPFHIGEIWWLFGCFIILCVTTCMVMDTMKERNARLERQQKVADMKKQAETKKTAIIYGWEIES
jgi:hypothetical protein